MELLTFLPSVVDKLHLVPVRPWHLEQSLMHGLILMG
jgi:hypothetical protein